VLPGFGRLIVEAVFTRDYPVVQGVVLITATSYVLINLLVDVSDYASFQTPSPLNGELITIYNLSRRRNSRGATC